MVDYPARIANEPDNPIFEPDFRKWEGSVFLKFLVF